MVAAVFSKRKCGLTSYPPQTRQSRTAFSGSCHPPQTLTDIQIAVYWYNDGSGLEGGQLGRIIPEEIEIFSGVCASRYRPCSLRRTMWRGIPRRKSPERLRRPFCPRSCGIRRGWHIPGRLYSSFSGRNLCTARVSEEIEKGHSHAQKVNRGDSAAARSRRAGPQRKAELT